MAKQKESYNVFTRLCYLADPGFGFPDKDTEWKLLGSTWAVSEAQAINNVRYRFFGKDPAFVVSQGCRYSVLREFKAIKEN